jgi:uncharacterized protein
MNRIPIRGLRLRPGAEHRVTVGLDLEPFVFGGEAYTAVSGRAEAELAVQRAASGDVFHLAFSTALEGPCMRCLAPARVAIEVDAREYEATDPGADEELRSEYVADGELDAGAWARDQVALVVPDQILCRPDCAGLCPVCGKDLNVEPHVHAEEAVDPRWAALESLRGDAGPD